jgi:sugar transferase (PEP-CTERM/EpsH1 system associated)
VDHLRQFCETVDVAILPKWRAQMQAASLACSPLPLTLAYYFSAELAAKIAYRLATQKFDIIHAYSSSTAQYVDWACHLPRVMQFADLDSIKWREMYEMKRWPQSWVYGAEAVRLLQYERSIARRYQRCLVVTEEERQEMERLIPHVRGAVAANGVDIDFFSPSKEEPEPDHLVFVGVMDYWPNEEGAEFFAREVLPLVRQARPEALFTVVGARPSKRVLALGELPGVTVTGPVEDIRPYMRRAALAVIPLRLARGVQNKVLEAMSMAMATVSTTNAFRGVRAREGEHGLVADDPRHFADQVTALLGDRQRCVEMGRKARQVMVDRYSWEARVGQLAQLYEEVISEWSPRGVARSNRKVSVPRART